MAFEVLYKQQVEKEDDQEEMIDTHARRHLGLSMEEISMLRG